MFIKKIVAILLLTSIFSCGHNKGHDDFQDIKHSYWLYSRIIQVVNRKNEDYQFVFTENKLKKVETDALISILKERKYQYKLTLDSQIMISKVSAPNIETLSFIESELKSVLKDSSSMWKWK